MGTSGARARLFFRAGELNDLWAATIYGASLAPSLDGFAERRLAELHARLERYARPRAGGFEFASYPGDRRLLAQLSALAPEVPSEEDDGALLRLLVERPPLLALDPDVESLVNSRYSKTRKDG